MAVGSPCLKTATYTGPTRNFPLNSILKFFFMLLVSLGVFSCFTNGEYKSGKAQRRCLWDMWFNG